MTRLVRLVAATFVVAAAGLAAPAPSAYAAACSGDSGVSVVVDFNDLGGGVQQVCIAGGGGDAASSLFGAAGFSLSYASRQPGFVCRVEGKPASDPCVNTSPPDAFWGLWWSDGDASSWTYSSLGAGSLKIPDGGMVAFSWDDVGGTAPPSASPSHPDPPAPPPTSQPPPQQSDDPGQSQQVPGQGSSSAPDGSTTGPTSSPSGSPEVEHGKGSMDQERHPGKGKHQSAPPGGSPTQPETTPPDTTATGDESVAEPASDSESDGLPGWVAPTLIAVLFAAASVLLLIRQRRSGP